MAKCFLSCLLLLYCLCSQADSYTLGNGYNIGSWNLSGYSSIELHAPTQQQQKISLALDEIAVFGQARFYQYLNPFFEIEYASQPIFTEGKGIFSKAGRFDLERLYNDARVTDELTFRLGKMLAPVGEWNQIHANPLVATETRPLTTFLNFSEFISGISLNYNPESEWLPEMKFYYQPWTELVPKNIKTRPVRYKNVSGIHLQYGDEFSGQIALSIQHAELTTRKERQTVYTMDGIYAFDWVKLSSQIFYASVYGAEIKRRRNHEWVGYLQLVAPITERWSLVGRGETFTQRDAIESQQNAVFGVNYRTQTTVVWKLEYVLHRGANLGINEGVFGSFGMMF